MSERHRVERDLVATAFGVFAVIAVLATGALVRRSFESWTRADPVTIQRMLDLTEQQRQLKREWESAQRGDARFELDGEIRLVTERIEALDRLVRMPRRTLGLENWSLALPNVGGFLVRVAEAAAEAAIGLVLALALAGRIVRFDRRTRIAALVALALPLVLPRPVWATAVVRLAAIVDWRPSPGLAFASEVAVSTALAAVVLVAALARLDRRSIETARDRGLGGDVPWRVVVPTIAPTIAVVFLLALARGLDDLSVDRIVGADAPGFAAWLRHRCVATLAFPEAAAGSIVLWAIVAAFAAPIAVFACRRIVDETPPNRFPAFPPLARSRIPGPAVAATAALGAAAILAFRSASDLAPAVVDEGTRLAALAVELARAGLATVLALAFGWGMAMVFARATPKQRTVARILVIAACAVPAAPLALALRLTAQDLGLGDGGWIALFGATAAAAAPATAFLVLPPIARAHIVPLARRSLAAALVPRLLARLPIAAFVTFWRTLVAADAGSTTGLVDRSALLPLPRIAFEPTVIAAFAVAGLLAVAVAHALEAVRDR